MNFNRWLIVGLLLMLSPLAYESLRAEQKETDKLIEISVPDQDASQLIKLAEEADALTAVARGAQEVATAAQARADLYTQRALAAKKAYEASFYKVGGELKVDFKKYKPERRGASLVFVPKEERDAIKANSADSGP